MQFEICMCIINQSNELHIAGKMKTRYLGSSGVKVSELCLGTMALSVTGNGYV